MHIAEYKQERRQTEDFADHQRSRRVADSLIDHLLQLHSNGGNAVSKDELTNLVMIGNLQ